MVRTLKMGGAILLVTALALTGVAMAQTDEASRAPDGSDRIRAALQPLVEEGTITDQQADRVAEHLSQVGRPRVRDWLRGLLRYAAEGIGVSAEVVAQGLAEGLTVSEIAEQHGSTGAAVVADLMAAAQERLAAAVESGRIDQQQAGEYAARLEARLNELVNTPHPGREVVRHHVRDHVRHRIGAHVGRELADGLGMTPPELREALAGGAIVAELAAAAGFDLDGFVSGIVQAMEERAARALEAGRVSEEAVAEHLAAFEEALRQRLGLG